jgi:hypothetical protein
VDTGGDCTSEVYGDIEDSIEELEDSIEKLEYSIRRKTPFSQVQRSVGCYKRGSESHDRKLEGKSIACGEFHADQSRLFQDDVFLADDSWAEMHAARLAQQQAKHDVVLQHAKRETRRLSEIAEEKERLASAAARPVSWMLTGSSSPALATVSRSKATSGPHILPLSPLPPICLPGRAGQILDAIMFAEQNLSLSTTKVLSEVCKDSESGLRCVVKAAVTGVREAVMRVRENQDDRGGKLQISRRCLPSGDGQIKREQQIVTRHPD